MNMSSSPPGTMRVRNRPLGSGELRRCECAAGLSAGRFQRHSDDTEVNTPSVFRGDEVTPVRLHRTPLPRRDGNTPSSADVAERSEDYRLWASGVSVPHARVAEPGRRAGLRNTLHVPPTAAFHPDTTETGSVGTFHMKIDFTITVVGLAASTWVIPRTGTGAYASRTGQGSLFADLGARALRHHLYGDGAPRLTSTDLIQVSSMRDKGDVGGIHDQFRSDFVLACRASVLAFC